MKALEAFVAQILLPLSTVDAASCFPGNVKRIRLSCTLYESVGIWALVWTKSVLSLALLSPVIVKFKSKSKCYMLFSHSLKKKKGGGMQPVGNLALAKRPSPMRASSTEAMLGRWEE